MKRFKNTIWARVIAHSSLFFGVVLVQAGASVLTLHAVAQQSIALQQTWLDGATVLGEIDFSAQAFRTAEVQRALLLSAVQRDQAESLAQAQRRQVATLERQYETLRGDTNDLAPFAQAWALYMRAHDQWVSADPYGVNNAFAVPGSALRRADHSADLAIDALIRQHHDQSQRAAASVALELRHLLALDGLTTLVGLLLTVGMQQSVRRRVIAPISEITQAMTRLAAGERDTEIPTDDGLTEIRNIAAACEVFRQNVAALDVAHEAARRAEEQAQKLARHDALTGLPNRRVFAAELEDALARAHAGTSTYTVLLLDLDEFKKINDIQGHAAGDAVLCTVAARLQGAVRKGDTVARLGGDEFAIITQGGPDLGEHLDHTKHLAARLLGIIRHPITLGDTAVEVGASIGVASCGTTAADVSSVLRAADIAMYRAKQSGRFTFRFFEQSMDDEMRTREALERDLTQALAAGDIRPYYQPLVDLTRQRIRGFEALARWHHAQRGFVAPDVFIPILEQLGLMSTLSTTMLRQACRDARTWPADICVAINISPVELRDATLPERFAAILAETGLPAQRLEVEITETALVSDLESAKRVLGALQAQGVAISLDDFGTGYSSLYHLRELKFDKVKIDRSFVLAMQANSDSEKIIDAILGLTHSLHLPTVAEGIEDLTALNMLTNKGCRYGQGFYFGKAVPADEAAALLALDSACSAIS